MMENSQKEKKSGLSESFVMGVIAIVFLVIGYQTALFIHHAAVMKIMADRDEPDTVFVHVPSETYEESGSDALDSGSGSLSSGKHVVIRKNAEHLPRAEVVRQNVPLKRVETFHFDPNTVSIDDLCRLGFTRRQAQVIDNYRKKGGRFRKKEDFARSYVVADSVFLRLEKYIDIPLVDLNTADSASFDALPGIGGWFAAKIIEHRKALGGYSYKEQLMDIYRFDQSKYEALKDLIIVSPEYVTPYPLWSLPADSLRLHPYISNYETARAIVLYRETSPRDEWTIAGLENAGILSSSSATRLAACAIK